MAEISTNNRQPIVDMTPMVDLGFLLITFFVFTTTFTTNQMMALKMPDKSNNPIDIPKLKYSNTLTLILGKNNRIFWHQKSTNDLNSSILTETNYGTTLSKLIVEKRKKADNPEYFTVIIHPADVSNYKNTVDVLDEMTIINQKIYVLADIQPKEVAVYEAKLKL